MIQADDSGCQVVICPGYTELNHPISRKGNWGEIKQTGEKKSWQQEFNSFLYKKSLERLGRETEKAMVIKRP